MCVCSCVSQILARDGDRSEKALVFCNSVDSCRAVEHTLREAGTPTLCYHGDMPAGQRKENMKTFLGRLQGMWALLWRQHAPT